MLDQREVLASLLVATVHPDEYQRRTWLTSQVAELQRQRGLASSFEVLLLGTIALDDELGIVRAVVTEQPGVWRHVLFRTDPGVYVMWNEGWRRSRGKFVATLNLDDRLRPDALQVKTRFMLAHPECDVLSCEVVVTHNATAPYTHHGQRWFTSGGSNRHTFFSDGAHTYFRATTFFGVTTTGGAHVRGQNPPHNSPFFRRDLIEWLGQGGAFRPQFDPTSDSEIWSRATVQGAGVCHVSDALQTYFINPKSHNRRNASKATTQHAAWRSEWLSFVSLRLVLLADEAMMSSAGASEVAAARGVELLVKQLRASGHSARFTTISCVASGGCEGRSRGDGNAEIAIVAVAPAWRCAEVKGALALARTMSKGGGGGTATRLALLLPPRGTRLRDHTCVAEEAVTPATQASMLLVWGHSLADGDGGGDGDNAGAVDLSGVGEPIGSGRHAGGTRLLSFAALRHASALHIRACVRSVSPQPAETLQSWARNGSLTLGVSKRVHAVTYALHRGHCDAD